MITITTEMEDAGEKAIMEEVGGADLGGLFSARDLAKQVFAAMASCDARYLLASKMRLEKLRALDGSPWPESGKAVTFVMPFQPAQTFTLNDP